MEKTDMVNHPPHYQSKKGIEVIDVIEAFTEGLQGIEAVCTGNVIKYICRWKDKNGLEDLKKCKWYLEKLINRFVQEGMVITEDDIKINGVGINEMNANLFDGDVR